MAVMFTTRRTVALGVSTCANAGYNLVRRMTDGVGIGPILMGLAA